MSPRRQTWIEIRYRYAIQKKTETSHVNAFYWLPVHGISHDESDCHSVNIMKWPLSLQSMQEQNGQQLQWSIQWSIMSGPKSEHKKFICIKPGVNKSTICMRGEKSEQEDFMELSSGEVRMELYVQRAWSKEYKTMYKNKTIYDFEPGYTKTPFTWYDWNIQCDLVRFDRDRRGWDFKRSKIPAFHSCLSLATRHKAQKRAQIWTHNRCFKGRSTWDYLKSARVLSTIPHATTLHSTYTAHNVSTQQNTKTFTYFAKQYCYPFKIICNTSQTNLPNKGAPYRQESHQYIQRLIERAKGR